MFQPALLFFLRSLNGKTILFGVDNFRDDITINLFYDLNKPEKGFRIERKRFSRAEIKTLFYNHL